MIIVFKHKITQRYLVGILPNKDIETCKLIEDAKKWKINSYKYGRRNAVDSYIRKHKEHLENFDEIHLTNDT